MWGDGLPLQRQRDEPECRRVLHDRGERADQHHRRGGGGRVENNDFETGLNSFTYGIEARDAVGNWSATETVTLSVTDVDENAPAITAGQVFTYAENQVAGAWWPTWWRPTTSG